MNYYLVVAIGISSFCFTRSAIAYDTGNMSCDDIGEFAAATVIGKQNGATLKEALAKVRKKTEGYVTEQKVLTAIVRQIYTAPWANKLSDKGARTAFATDCEAQR